MSHTDQRANTHAAGLRISRRAALLGLGGALSLGRASLALADAPGEKRLVVILLRGAMDGMHAVVPIGDRNLRDLRADLLPDPQNLLDLGGFFALHPKFSALHAMYAAGEAGFVHAAAGSYRTRSHFEAQDYLEAGVEQRIDSGWLNRAVSALNPPPGRELALSLGLSAPLLLRGPAAVQAWAPEKFATPDGDLLARISALSARDPVLGPGFAGIMAQRNSGDPAADVGKMPGGGPRDFARLAMAAGKWLASDNGPRIAALEIGGWDTHQAQIKRLEAQFSELDEGLAALKDSLGAAWKSTAVVAMTEFGRTARANGTGGTDHGTAGVAILAGGAIAGGRVLGTWPGLGSGQLFENRDLAPTTDLRSIAKGLLVSHLGLAASRLEGVFPGSAAASPMGGLIRA